MAQVEVTNSQFKGTDQNPPRKIQIEGTDPLPTGLTAEDSSAECLNVDTGVLHAWHINRWVEQ